MKKTITIDPRMCLECPFLSTNPLSTQCFCNAYLYITDMPPAKKDGLCPSGRILIDENEIKDIPRNCPLKDI